VLEANSLLNVLKHSERYWFWCDGPNGREWLLGRYTDRMGPRVFLDGMTVAVQPMGHHFWLHKWRIIEVHACQPPRQPTNLLWQVGEVTRGC